ncbi:hypothetical protein [Sphingomonas sp. PAMC 26605]|nr:hypothetical protein [Sphingomonas sp. PAMC 26605]
MGWLFMRDMGGYATPRSYLDNQFTKTSTGARDKCTFGYKDSAPFWR